MKKLSSILGCSVVLTLSGGFNVLSSCATNAEHYEKTPRVREKRLMNPNVPNITVGDFRLQILDKSTVRFEYKYENPVTHEYGWLDDDTLFIPERTLYQGVDPGDYHVDRNSDYVTVTIDDIVIKVPTNIGKDLKGIVVTMNGQTVYESNDSKNDNTGDLPEPSATPKCFELVDYPRIIEPIYGYSTYNLQDQYYRLFKDTCGFDIQNQKDIYLTFPRNDAKALRQQYRNLAGAPEMVRLSTLGAWDSRYYPYNEQTVQDEVDHYYVNQLPLDNLVIDTDWRAGFDGKGYFINETLFPDMPRLLKSMHNQNLEVCFNDHPEPQKDDSDNELDVLNQKEVDFRSSNLRKILDMGLNTWWYDRNWSTSLICPGGKTDEHEAWLNHETWGDYLYNNVTKQYNIMHAKDKYDEYGNYSYKRPTAMSNIVQIRNGVWEGFTDSMAHRYSIQWTGDQNFTMLPTEIENVVKTGLNCMPYMSSDLAGHNQGVADDYYYQRWIEYGALSPIFRMHCTRDLEQHCQPWYRPTEVLNTYRNWINLRYRLLPLYYSLARQAYDTGLPICRAMGLVDPSVEDIDSQYLIGDNILFAPCTQSQDDLVKDDSWVTWDKVDPTQPGIIKVDLYNGRTLQDYQKTVYESNFSNFKSMDQYAIQHGVGNPKGEDFSARITAKFTVNSDQDKKCVWINVDDGVKLSIKNAGGQEVVTAEDWTQDGHSARYLKTEVPLLANQTYTLSLDYNNKTSGGTLEFAGYKHIDLTSEYKTVTFPSGKWLDVFHGDVYHGPVVKKDIEFMPNENAVFVKLGTMLPLINNAQNTKSFDWSNITYDIYPSTDIQPYSSYLYEDDFETVGYQDGHYRKSNYSCYYDSNNNQIIIQLNAPEGEGFIGDDSVSERQFNIRIHKINGFNFGQILVDDQVVTPTKIDVDTDIPMPFNFDGASRTENVLTFTITKGPVTKGHVITIQLN